MSYALFQNHALNTSISSNQTSLLECFGVFQIDQNIERFFIGQFHLIKRPREWKWITQTWERDVMECDWSGKGIWIRTWKAHLLFNVKLICRNVNFLDSILLTLNTSTTPQSMMNAKLSLLGFWHCHENGLIKTIQTMPLNLYVSFRLASLNCGFKAYPGLS